MISCSHGNCPDPDDGLLIEVTLEMPNMTIVTFMHQKCAELMTEALRIHHVHQQIRERADLN